MSFNHTGTALLFLRVAHSSWGNLLASSGALAPILDSIE